jgi:DNA topoisomerase VI subunit A
LLERLPDEIKVVVFVDIDPAGIHIALTTAKVTQILAPTIEVLSSIIKSSSSSEDFDTQHQQAKYMQQYKSDWQVLQHFIV